MEIVFVLVGIEGGVGKLCLVLVVSHSCKLGLDLQLLKGGLVIVHAGHVLLGGDHDGKDHDSQAHGGGDYGLPPGETSLNVEKLKKTLQVA